MLIEDPTWTWQLKCHCWPWNWQTTMKVWQFTLTVAKLAFWWILHTSWPQLGTEKRPRWVWRHVVTIPPCGIVQCGPKLSFCWFTVRYVHGLLQCVATTFYFPFDGNHAEVGWTNGLVFSKNQGVLCGARDMLIKYVAWLPWVVRPQPLKVSTSHSVSTLDQSQAFRQSNGNKCWMNMDEWDSQR